MPAIRRHRRPYVRITIPLIACAMIVAGLLLQSQHAKQTYAEVDMRGLGLFPLDQTNGSIADVPLKLLAYDGKKVHLQGFMYSPDAADSKVSNFQFVYTLLGHDHGPPLVQERVFATAARPVPYIDFPADLYGTLHVNVQHDPAGGEITSVYTIDVDGVNAIESMPVAGSTAIANLPEPASVTIGKELVVIGIAAMVLVGLRELLLLIGRFPSRTMAARDVCPVCGYDVRASPERCPECGTPTGRSPVGAQNINP